jgi:hypothetical protein
MSKILYITSLLLAEATKTLGILLLMAVAAIVTIGIGTTEHAFAFPFGGFGPGCETTQVMSLLFWETIREL